MALHGRSTVSPDLGYLLLRLSANCVISFEILGPEGAASQNSHLGLNVVLVLNSSKALCMFCVYDVS